MAYVSDSNLTQFWGLAKDYINAEDGRFANWQQTEKAGAVTCWPVGGTELLPTVDFLFTETGPASGTKGPDNPSSISGVSEVKVGRAGKNLLFFPSASSGNGWSRDASGMYTITESSSPIDIWLYPFGLEASILAGTYTFSLNNSIALPNCRISLRNSNGGWGTSDDVVGRDGYAADANYSRKIVIPEVNNNARILVSFSAGTYNTTVAPQFELGDVATSREPPAGETDTLPLGSTYYGGSIDLATGVMTVTWEGDVCTSFASVDVISTNTISFRYNASAYHPAIGILNNQMACNRFPVINNSDDVEHCRFSGAGNTNTLRFYINKTRLDVSGAVDPSNPTNAEWVTAANVWLASHSTFLVYILATPYTVQLTPTQILALSQTDKYTPRLNTVYTDASVVQVGYAKSPIRSEYELTQAIIATEGGE